VILHQTMGCVLGREIPKEAETGGLEVVCTEPSDNSIITPLKGENYFLKSQTGKLKPVGAAARARRGSVRFLTPGERYRNTFLRYLSASGMPLGM